MKASKTVLILLILLNSCMKEDYDNCPKDTDATLLIHFEYFDAKGKDIFNQRIHNIEVIIFDEDTCFYKQLAVNPYQLSLAREVKYEIDPGKYFIMAWANISELSDIPTPTEKKMHFEDIQLKHLATHSTDTLHYAPDKRCPNTVRVKNYKMYEVDVQPEGITEHTLSFMSAHRTVNIYIDGLERLPDVKTDITELFPAYDYHLIPFEENTISFQQYPDLIRFQNGKELLYAKYYIPHFSNENEIEINVSGTIGTPFTDTKTMQEFLYENKIVVFDGDDLIIDILFSYEQGHLVDISIPEWSSLYVNPSFD